MAPEQRASSVYSTWRRASGPGESRYALSRELMADEAGEEQGWSVLVKSLGLDLEATEG